MIHSVLVLHLHGDLGSEQRPSSGSSSFDNSVVRGMEGEVEGTMVVAVIAVVAVFFVVVIVGTGRFSGFLSLKEGRGCHM